ncbi:MAG: bestrophin family ion channel, partial [Myxococcota bacterium]
MTNDFKRNPVGMLRWQARNVVKYGLMATAAWILIEPLGLEWLRLPVMPISIVGAGIGIFVSFRANQAYDRWWEGRKLWGRMINSSRHWSSQVLRYLGDQDAALAERLVMRHVTYVHTLRTLLRGQDPFADADFDRTVHDDDRDLKGS